VLSEVLRAGRASTAELSPLSTPDSILMFIATWERFSMGGHRQKGRECKGVRYRFPRWNMTPLCSQST